MESEAKRLALEQLYQDNFNPEEYLSTYYRSLDAEVEFFLSNLHHFFFVSNGKLQASYLSFVSFIMCFFFFLQNSFRFKKRIAAWWLVSLSTFIPLPMRRICIIQKRG
jgi:hypothetical protein